MRDFSRSLSKLLVIARNSDWFIALFAPVVVGRRNYFGNGFFDSHFKTAIFLLLLLSHVSYLAFCSYFVGSIPLDPSLAQSLEDGQAFTDLFPNSPTLDAVNKITSKLLEMKNGVSD